MIPKLFKALGRNSIIVALEREQAPQLNSGVPNATLRVLFAPIAYMFFKPAPRVFVEPLLFCYPPLPFVNQSVQSWKVFLDGRPVAGVTILGNAALEQLGRGTLSYLHCVGECVVHLRFC
jgi:hypothetical protein